MSPEEFDEEPDKLRGIPTIGMMDSSLEDAEQEMMDMMKYGLNNIDYYPSLAVYQLISRVLSLDYEDKLKSFEEREQEIDKKYKSTAISRNYRLTFAEAQERFQNTILLGQEVGPLKVDESNAYYGATQADYIDFKDWGEDK